MSPRSSWLWMFLIVWVFAWPASAQERPVSVSAVGGLSAASGTGGATIGATLAFDVAPRIRVEARGIWLDRGTGASGGEVTGNVLIDLLATRSAVPYIVAGGGLYRARFDLDRSELLGGIGSQFGPGSRVVPLGGTSSFGMMDPNDVYAGHMWTGPWPATTYAAPQMPVFYANRMGQMLVPANGMWGMRAFTDPTVAIGGGVRMTLTDRVWLRPEARALVVFGDGNTYSMGTFSFGLGFRF